METTQPTTEAELFADDTARIKESLQEALAVARKRLSNHDIDECRDTLMDASNEEGGHLTQNEAIDTIVLLDELAVWRNAAKQNAAHPPRPAILDEPVHTGTYSIDGFIGTTPVQLTVTPK